MYQASIEKSIERILKTPIGSRVMRPEFGSNLFELIDKRPDDAWQMDCIRYTYEAINKWEPRVKVEKVIPEKVKLINKEGNTEKVIYGIVLRLFLTVQDDNTQKEIQISI